MKSQRNRDGKQERTLNYFRSLKDHRVDMSDSSAGRAPHRAKVRGGNQIAIVQKSSARFGSLGEERSVTQASKEEDLAD